MKLTEELIRKRKHRDALEAFLAGPAHAGYVVARRTELQAIEKQILEFDPVTREQEIEQFKLRGEKRCLEGMVEVFVGALEQLKDEIDELESTDFNEVNAQPRKRDRYEDALTSS
jgi:hypothetical protein